MSNDERRRAVQEAFVRRFQVSPAEVRTVFAPYRICPLGAHVDHQLGQVTAMALDEGIFLAFAPLPSAEARVASLDFPGEVHVPFQNVPSVKVGDWGDYVRGAVCALQPHYPLNTGLAAVVQGGRSEGGLSSSAAVGVAYLLALEAVNDLPVSPQQNILFDQCIENSYLGLRNGILDQSAILLSRRRHLTWIDCSTGQHTLLPQPTAMPPFAILLVFSGLRRALVSTDYNRRVAECEEAARLLLAAAGRRPDEPRLGHVPVEAYRAFGSGLSGPAALRARHFFAEIERVQFGAAAWQRGDLTEFGRLVTASGESSITNYECGAPPLIDLHRMLVATDGVYGARFSGAGFRGCCLALADPQRAAEIAATVLANYRQQQPELAASAHTLLCQSGDGARLQSPRQGAEVG